jgi:hypothetical protein
MAEHGCDLDRRQAIEATMNCGLPLVVTRLDDTAPSSRIASEREMTVQRQPRQAVALGTTVSRGGGS